MPSRTHRPGVTTRGTAKDLADHGVGYSSNGEGEYSRRSAQAPEVTMVGFVPKGRGKQTTPALIAEHTSLLAKLRGEMLLETDPARLAKLKKNFDIKQRFVDRLRNETLS
jgi:hypothetical protein